MYITKKLLVTKLILTAALIFGGAAITNGQVEGKVCISQEAANVCKTNATQVEILEKKVAALQADIDSIIKIHEEEVADLKATNKKNIDELTETSRLNVADLTGRLRDTENKLAGKTGELIKMEDTLTFYQSMLQFMLQNGRKKCGLLSICIQ